MNKSSIYVNQSLSQVQDVQKVKWKSFYQLLKSIAHENGNYINSEFTVNVHGLDISDQRLILSYIVDSEDYEWACSSINRTEALYKDHINYIKQQMCDVENETYIEIMEEAGFYLCHHKDNHEVYWERY